MDGDKFSTPLNFSSRLRSSAPKRDSLAAELERDPQLSTAKRKQRTQAFTTHMNQSALERQLVAAQAAKVELESKLREKDVLIERLEDDRRYLADKEKQEKEEKERERTEREEEKRKSDSDLRALRNSYMALREQQADLEDAHSSLSRSTAHTISSQRSEIATLTRQVAHLQEELREVKNLADSRSHTVEELQAKLDDLSATQDSISHRTLNDEDGWAIIREELHRQTDYLHTVEAANVKMSSDLAVLKQRDANLEVLKEQKRDLKRKVQGVDELREKLVKLEAELAAARKERQDWGSRSSGPGQTPVSVTQSLTSLRLTYARLLEEHGSNIALLRRREVELADAERSHEEARSRVETLQSELDTIKYKADRYEHRAQLAEREIGSLKAMLASFYAEQAAQEDGKIEEATSNRIQHLESLVADYQTTVAQMEKEIEDLGGDPTTLGGTRPRQDLLDELELERKAKVEAEQASKEAETDAEKYLEKIEELEQRLFELQGEIGGGRHVPPGVRVLSLHDNPAQQWVDLSQAAMDRLKSENEALLNRLKELENSGASTGHSGNKEELVPRESWEVVNKEKSELEEALKQKEKRLTRLKQVFSAKTDEFKEAIASILGVKLAFYPNGQPMKGSNLGMTMQLVAQGEGGPEDLPQLMRYWVEQEQCIPGFLASITLQCYEQRKMEEQHDL
ncbi:hypothetical protein EW026_g3974 [Hermanssonia centrifuga]|uniref:Spindle assembly checkpoint component MAD1 n=1 Tax=Hermanssonia centrifuga TaxID=98765 RepID=A0A4S4KJN0_9APHY|nr:hypothetical protein EW026_g3974 [Hermanssonia centrifuga]